MKRNSGESPGSLDNVWIQVNKKNTVGKLKKTPVAVLQ
jgi:hypothetical protein